MPASPETHPSGSCPVVVDLGYGDAGKGALVDRLVAASGAEVVIRFNGGAQAAHTVVAEGRTHTFAQFGAGTLAGAATHLSRFHLLEPLALAGEARALELLGVADPLARISVSPESALTTPVHRALNRARERSRGQGAHGSCGIGIGESVRAGVQQPQTQLRAGECHSAAEVLKRLRESLSLLDEPGLRAHLRRDDAPELDDLQALAEAYAAFAHRVEIVPETRWEGAVRAGRAVFEGAQGVLLDQDGGFHPHTTWSSTTSTNAEALIRELGGHPWRIGVIRGYGCRHGSGPMPGEAPELRSWFPELHNGVGPWQGEFRVGQLDLVSLRWALRIQGGIDTLAVGHLDRIEAVLRAEPTSLAMVVAHHSSGERREHIQLARAHDRAAQELDTAWLSSAQAETLSAAELGITTASAWARQVGGALGVAVGVESWGAERSQYKSARSAPAGEVGTKVRDCVGA